MTTIWSIQYLRAIAAIAVVLVHALGAEAIAFPIGAAGVDLFFIISGFIMWMLTVEAETAPAAFAWRRLVRIVPLYWAMTLATAAVLIARPNFLVHTDASIGHIWRSLIFVPHANGEGDIFPVVVQGWTLNYEMFFYALVALSLFAPARLRLGVLSAILIALASAGALFNPQDPIASTYTDPLLLEFLAGIWLAHLWRKNALRGKMIGWSAIAIGVGALAVETLVGQPESPRVLLWGLPALFIVAGALALEASGAVGKFASLRLLGDASYAIYLVHGLLAGFVNWFAPATLPGLHGGATLIGSIVAGALIYKLFEQNVTRMLRGRGPSPRRALQAAQTKS